MKTDNAAHRAGCIRAEWMMVFAMVVALAVNNAPGGIVNGGFEDGLNGWSGGGFIVSTSPKTPTEGTHYAGAEFEQGQSGTKTLWQQFTVPAGTQWLYADLALIGFGGIKKAQLILPTGTIELWLPPAENMGMVNADFTRYRYDISAYAGQPDLLTLNFEVIADGSASARLFVDRIALEAVPEPATIALLGMGLMLMMPRRSSRR
ncbi:MAG: PEP-CTERM sorting domain-containing protein [Phycisphaeraceae bacterium]